MASTYKINSVSQMHVLCKHIGYKRHKKGLEKSFECF